MFQELSDFYQKFRMELSLQHFGFVQKSEITKTPRERLFSSIVKQFFRLLNPNGYFNVFCI